MIKGRGLRRHIGPVVVNSNDQGAAVASHDEFVRLVGTHDTQTPSAVALIEGFGNGVLQVRAIRLGRLFLGFLPWVLGLPRRIVVIANQFRKDFGIRLTLARNPFGEQVTTQVSRIDEGSIVHQGNLFRNVNVGMRIEVRLGPVRRPTRMGNAHGVAAATLGPMTDQVDRIGVVAGTGKARQDLKCRVCE